MTILLQGKPVADGIRSAMIKEIEQLKADGIVPTVAIVRAGERPDDIAYESRIITNCGNVGMAARAVTVPADISMADFASTLEELNQDPDVHGILVFRPLPDQLDADAVSRIVRPDKDIDCMNPVNAAGVFLGDERVLLPCTPAAVMEILRHYGYGSEGLSVAVVNRSLVLGKPLAMLFLKENATVTICHSRTKDLRSVTKRADVVVTGVGRADFFDETYFSPHSVIIDVGINFNDKGMCGDVSRERVLDKVAALTPVPGGVGTVTSMILLRNVLSALRLQSEGGR